MSKPVPESVIKAMHASMASPNFYGPQITIEYIRARIESLQSGNRPSGGPDMFISEWLKKGEYL